MPKKIGIAPDDESFRDALRKAQSPEALLKTLKAQAMQTATAMETFLWQRAVLYASFSDAHDMLRKKQVWSKEFGIASKKKPKSSTRTVMQKLHHLVFRDLDVLNALVAAVCPEELASMRATLGANVCTCDYAILLAPIARDPIESLPGD